MDPSMMQGAPPMDPAAMQGGAPPIDPATGQPMMDPAAMGGAPPADPNAGAITPETIDQILGLLEEMGQKMEGDAQANKAFQDQIGQAIQDMGAQLDDLDKRVAEMAAQAAAAPDPLAQQQAMPPQDPNAAAW